MKANIQEINRIISVDYKIKKIYFRPNNRRRRKNL